MGGGGSIPNQKQQRSVDAHARRILALRPKTNYWTEHIINFSPLAGRLMYPCTVNEPPAMQVCT